MVFGDHHSFYCGAVVVFYVDGCVFDFYPYGVVVAVGDTDADVWAGFGGGGFGNISGLGVAFLDGGEEGLEDGLGGGHCYFNRFGRYVASRSWICSIVGGVYSGNVGSVSLSLSKSFGSLRSK